LKTKQVQIFTAEPQVRRSGEIPMAQLQLLLLELELAEQLPVLANC